MYCIKEGYIQRIENDFFDDTVLKDEWQNEVYQVAKELAVTNNFKVIYDLGCGSGYKLLKYFNDYETVGIDLAPTIEWLKKQYPNKTWTDDISQFPVCDLLICADVIEHVLDPDKLLALIDNAQPKLIVISTPDRDLLNPEEQNGPPGNKAHVREWNFKEFENYISQHFEIIEHFISNRKQCTQLVVARRKHV